MNRKRTDSILLAISTIGFFLMSVSFILMPLESMGVFPGAVFWAGLVLGVALQIVLEARRRAFFAKYNMKCRKMQKPRNGLLTFGSNPLAKIADGAMIISAGATIIAYISTKGLGVACYVFIAATVFTFCLHCILNGRIYFHAKNQMKVQQVLDQKKLSTLCKGAERK